MFNLMNQCFLKQAKKIKAKQTILPSFTDNLKSFKMVINSYFQSDQGKAVEQRGHAWMVSFETKFLNLKERYFSCLIDGLGERWGKFL